MALQPNEHTWDISIYYHRCPSCGFIFTSRQVYHYDKQRYLKELECPRCHASLTATKPARPATRSLWGTHRPAEFDWS
jgi:uncharacterized C2H2 Zn-finger protein